MDVLEENYRGPESEVGILMSNFNGRVGREREGLQNILGPFGEEYRNREREVLLDFCIRNGVKIMNGFVSHRDNHKYKRYRWNGETGQFDHKSVVDYIIVT